MRLFYLFIFLLVFFYSQVSIPVFAVSPTSADCAITAFLHVGSRGAEVTCLQAKVRATVDGHFGPKTEVAVMVFQSSHGLVPDGIVGPLSRAALNSVIAEVYPAGCTSAVGYSPTTGTKCDSNSNPVASSSVPNNTVPTSPVVGTTNPNLVNMDRFIARIVDVNRKDGKSEEELQLIASTLKYKIENSTTDYNKKFKDLLISESKLSSNFKTPPSLSFFDKFVSKTLSFLGIVPTVAQAQAGIPFGGALLASFDECLNYEITILITSLPPTGVELLSYIPGTQGFASYNIPETEWLLGDYGGVGLCVLDYYPYVAYNTEGLIMPMVGSSPL